MTCLIFGLNTQGKTATLTIPTLQPSTAQQKFPLKTDFLFCLGVNLLRRPINYAIFSLPGDAPAPATPLATSMTTVESRANIVKFLSPPVLKILSLQWK